MKKYDNSSLVKGFLEAFEAKGLQITHADYGGYEKPEAVREQRPDVIAWDNEKHLYHIGAIMDSEKFNEHNTKKKIQVLSNLMMRKGPSSEARIPFYLGVPKGSLEKTNQILDYNKIDRTNVLTIEC